MKLNLSTEQIFTRTVSHKDSFWQGGKTLRNGLLFYFTKITTKKRNKLTKTAGQEERKRWAQRRIRVNTVDSLKYEQNAIYALF